MLILGFFLAPHLASMGQASAATVNGIYVCPPCTGDCHKLEFSQPGTCPVCGMNLIEKNLRKNVAIFLYEGVEILDFSGPGEVFAAATPYTGGAGFNVYTVAATKDPLLSQGFVRIVPEYSIDDCPRPDIIVLPGGNTRPSVENPKVVEWVKKNTTADQIGLSVCTGAFLLYAAGALEGKAATTWWGAVERLRKVATNTRILENVRWVDNGNIITTAGVSAGIDGALHVVEKLYGREAAEKTARYMEYDKWRPQEGVNN